MQAPGLEELNLAFTVITDSGLERLHSLPQASLLPLHCRGHISFCQSESLCFFPGQLQLQLLSLENCRAVSDTGLMALSSLTALRRLDIRSKPNLQCSGGAGEKLR